MSSPFQREILGFHQRKGFRKKAVASEDSTKMFSCINTVVVYRWPVRELALYFFLSPPPFATATQYFTRCCANSRAADSRWQGKDHISIEICKLKEAFNRRCSMFFFFQQRGSQQRSHKNTQNLLFRRAPHPFQNASSSIVRFASCPLCTKASNAAPYAPELASACLSAIRLLSQSR